MLSGDPVQDTWPDKVPFAPRTTCSNPSRAAVLRYGENPHQSAALYLNEFGPGLAQAPCDCCRRRREANRYLRIRCCPHPNQNWQ